MDITHIQAGTVFGAALKLCEEVFIGNDVGDRVTVKCGLRLWDGSSENVDVFIGSNMTSTNDLFLRSKDFSETYFQTRIEAGASIRGGAVTLPGLTIGVLAMVNAGSVIIKPLPAVTVMASNPARVLRLPAHDGDESS